MDQEIELFVINLQIFPCSTFLSTVLKWIRILSAEPALQMKTEAVAEFLYTKHVSWL